MKPETAPTPDKKIAAEKRRYTEFLWALNRLSPKLYSKDKIDEMLVKRERTKMAVEEQFEEVKTMVNGSISTLDDIDQNLIRWRYFFAPIPREYHTLLEIDKPRFVRDQYRETYGIKERVKISHVSMMVVKAIENLRKNHPQLLTIL